MPLLTVNFKLDNSSRYFLSVKLWLVVTVFKRIWSVIVDIKIGRAHV